MINIKKTIQSIVLSCIMSFLFPEYAASQVNGVYTDNGKTVEIDKAVHEIVTTTSSETLYFSNGLDIKLGTNSDLLVNNFYQNIETNSSPVVLKATDSTFEATLNKGSAWILCGSDTSNENSSCTISTPEADHELSKGSYYIQATDNKDISVTLDGSLKTTEGGSLAIGAKGFATIVVQENDTGILSSKESMYVDNVKADKLKELAGYTADVPGKVIFIRINGKTVGVLL